MAGYSITVGDFGGRFGGGASSLDGQLVIYGSDGKGLEIAADTANSQAFLYYNGSNRILFKQTGVTSFISNIASTSTSTGTVIVTGGIGVTGDIYASSFHGSDIYASSFHGSASGLTNIPITPAVSGFAASSFLSGTSNLEQMGLGSETYLTPISSGRVQITVMGFYQGTAVNNQAFVSVYDGTGTAPGYSFTPTPTGSNLGGSPVLIVNTVNTPVSFSFQMLRSGLTLGTQYWFDLITSSNLIGGGSVTITDMSIIVKEV